MERHFHEQLDDIKKKLMIMGGLAEEIVTMGIRALQERDDEMALSIFKYDKRIDMMELEVDGTCLKLLALQQPMAVDLRHIAGMMKISSDLERIGDHATNIAGSVLRLRNQADDPEMVNDLIQMAKTTLQMVKDSLDSFVERDAEKARSVCIRDDIVDGLNRSNIVKAIARMEKDSTMVRACVDYISISKDLERIADMATNVAEDVVFIYLARVIKHHADEMEGSDVGVEEDA